MRQSLGFLVGLSAVLALPVAAYADDSHPAAPAANSAAPVVAYVPPMMGAPEARISGGTRGKTDEPVRLDVLAPDHVGRTWQEQPTLYWFNSIPVKHDIEITLIVDKSNETLLDVTLHGPIPAGIHAYSLSGTKAHLQPQTVYQWSVTDQISKTEPSEDVVASGMIERFPAGTFGNPTPEGGLPLAIAFARAGVWYDAVAALSQEIDRKPADMALRKDRAGLLAQAGLTAPAAFDTPPAN